MLKVITLFSLLLVASSNFNAFASNAFDFGFDRKQWKDIGKYKRHSYSNKKSWDEFDDDEKKDFVVDFEEVKINLNYYKAGWLNIDGEKRIVCFGDFTKIADLNITQLLTGSDNIKVFFPLYETHKNSVRKLKGFFSITKNNEILDPSGEIFSENAKILEDEISFSCGKNKDKKKYKGEVSFIENNGIAYNVVRDSLGKFAAFEKDGKIYVQDFSELEVDDNLWATGALNKLCSFVDRIKQKKKNTGDFLKSKNCATYRFVITVQHNNEKFTLHKDCSNFLFISGWSGEEQKFHDFISYEDTNTSAFVGHEYSRCFFASSYAGGSEVKYRESIAELLFLTEDLEKAEGKKIAFEETFKDLPVEGGQPNLMAFGSLLQQISFKMVDEQALDNFLKCRFFSQGSCEMARFMELVKNSNDLENLFREGKFAHVFHDSEQTIWRHLQAEERNFSFDIKGGSDFEQNFKNFENFFEYIKLLRNQEKVLSVINASDISITLEVVSDRESCSYCDKTFQVLLGNHTHLQNSAARMFLTTMKSLGALTHIIDDSPVGEDNPVLKKFSGLMPSIKVYYRKPYDNENKGKRNV